MTQNRGKQRQLEKQKHKRELARKKAQTSSQALPRSVAAVVRLAVSRPFGRCFLGAGWDDESFPRLVTAVVTRELSPGLLVVATALVDRTCLGIKNAMVTPPLSEGELETLLGRVSEVHDGVLEAPLDLVQSIVFHAVDYARALGFEPNRDFHAELFGPRPETLLATPFARAEKPIYVDGPDDDVMRIVGQLGRAVGAGNFLLMHAPFEEDLDDDPVRDDDAGGRVLGEESAP